MSNLISQMVRMYFKHGNRIFASIIIVSILSSCYEGWDDLQYQEREPVEEPEIEELKPIAYILFQPIFMDAAALASDNCYPFESFRIFRANEWAERIAAISESLQDIAERAVTRSVAISADDCGALTAVDAVANSASPWGSDSNAPQQDIHDRPIIHLKATFWDTEPASEPSESVLETEWTAWGNLQESGYDAYSRHYNAVSNPEEGYFSGWFENQMNILEGTLINDVNPTTEGVEERRSIIAQDTKDLTNWLVPQ